MALTGTPLAVSAADGRWMLIIQLPPRQPEISHSSPAPGCPGAPGTEVWTLQAKAPGNTTVSSTYGRPWPGGE